MTTPTNMAAQVHRCLPLFRDQHSQVAAVAAHLGSGHVMQLDAMALSHEVPVGDDRPLAANPAELSDRLLRALFGAWPASRLPAVPGGWRRRRPAVTVREVSWETWEAAVERQGHDAD